MNEMKKYEAEVTVTYTFEEECDVAAIVEHGYQLIHIRESLRGVSNCTLKSERLGRVPIAEPAADKLLAVAVAASLAAEGGGGSPGEHIAAAEALEAAAAGMRRVDEWTAYLLAVQEAMGREE